jgi:acyl dehydratase
LAKLGPRSRIIGHVDTMWAKRAPFPRRRLDGLADKAMVIGDNAPRCGRAA